MEPPMFSMRDIFGACDSSEEDDDGNGGGEKDGDLEDQEFVEREHNLDGMALRIREFSFHDVNANLVWPGNSLFVSWLMEHPQVFNGKKILELGSGTGILAIFLKARLGCDITTCDYDDEQIESNIAHNCQINGIPPLPHVRHTWGTPFPIKDPSWDLVIASDILLYVKEYPNLIHTLSFLLKDSSSSTSTSNDPVQGPCILLPCAGELFRECLCEREVAFSADKDAPSHVAARGKTDEIERRRLSDCDGCSKSHRQRQDHSNNTPIVAADRIGIDLLPESNNKSECENASSTSVSVGGACFQTQICSNAKCAVSRSYVKKDGDNLALTHTTCIARDGDLSPNVRATIGEETVRICPSGRRCFLMSWRRRIGKKEEELFFSGCEAAGMEIATVGPRTYSIWSRIR